MYAAVVARIFEAESLDFHAKPIKAVLDESPIIHPENLNFWKWISDYYMCTMGEVMIAALPSFFKLSSESKISLNPFFEGDISQLDDNEYLLVEALQIQEFLDLDEVKRILDRKSVYFIIRSLIDKGVINVHEELKKRYKPKKKSFVRLSKAYLSDEKLNQAFDALKRAQKQENLLLAYLAEQPKRGDIGKKELLTRANASDAHLKGLRDKGIFEVIQKEVERLPILKGEEQLEVFELSENQQAALAEMRRQLERQNVLLLHGITSSGKTQLYIEIIQEYLAKGETVLYLLPEIALTAQMIKRLRKVFGNSIGVYHSKFNDQERIEIWNKVVSGQYKIVVGPRSTMFLPFQSLGLVIVDEEHDPSYKQQDPAPRYNARDASIYLASRFGAKTILGSATPSFESYFRSQQKKYAYVSLQERYGGIEPPEIFLVDVREAAKRKEMHAHFSNHLVEAIKDTLDKGEQVILFKNRRGFSPYLLCNECGFIPQCINCDVSLTYHRYGNSLKCHYCGYQKEMMPACPDCNTPGLRLAGFGTEKIEDEIQILFPEAVVARLDLETARTKTGYIKIIQNFEEGKTDILVGTQIVTKGLDFENVGLVGVLSADQLFFYPDFRALERAFQLMIQVSGRAGRRKKRGRVYIQTTDVEHPLFQHVLQSDFKSFYNTEISDREHWAFPPMTRLVQIVLKHRDQEMLNQASFWMGKSLEQVLKKVVVLGPTVPPVARVRNYYIRTLMIKTAPRSAESLAELKQGVHYVIAEMRKHKAYRAIIAQLDVDPY